MTVDDVRAVMSAAAPIDAAAELALRVDAHALAAADQVVAAGLGEILKKSES